MQEECEHEHKGSRTRENIKNVGNNNSNDIFERGGWWGMCNVQRFLLLFSVFCLKIKMLLCMHFIYFISFRFSAFKIEFWKLKSMQAAVYLLLFHYLNRNGKFEKVNALPLGDDRKMFGLFQMELVLSFRLHSVLDARVYRRGFNCSIDTSRCSKWCSLRRKDKIFIVYKKQ